MATALDHFYTFGDVSDTLDALDQLELVLGRLQRQRLLAEQDSVRITQQVGEIRTCLERQLPSQ
jgi:hypothetical protein